MAKRILIVTERPTEQILIRVTKDEKERLIRDMRLTGHRSWQTYVRCMLLTWLEFREKNQINMVRASSFTPKLKKKK